MKATVIWKREGERGEQWLCKLEPGLQQHDSWEGALGATHEYVIVSAMNVLLSGPETYIFGATDRGKIVDWSEMPGSFKGALDHEEALRRAGYTEIV